MRVEYPPGTLPSFAQGPLDSGAYGGQDGFSPAVQVLMHFPGGVDPALSGASRLLQGTRTHDDTSLSPASPTLLFDATDGMKPVRHWIERDARAADGPSPEREVTFLRPAELLRGGHRYVVAARRLVHPDGTPVLAEPVFAALRDRRPSDIPAVEVRRPAMERLLRDLRHAGVRRSDLVLAFDFVVQSDEERTGELLAMRDRAFEWLAEQPEATFTVFPFVSGGSGNGDVSIQYDCAAPGQRLWREVRGEFSVPLFLSADPLLRPNFGGRLVDGDGDGLPDVQGVMQAPYVIRIPCSVLEPGAPPLRPIVAGHGGFGNGRSAVGIAQHFANVEVANGGPDFPRIAGATDWIGMSSSDIGFFLTGVLLDLNNFGALPDRLRQGVTNTLVLVRMMHEGRFEADPAFRTPDGRGVFAGPGDTVDYFGSSLGAIMGAVLAATSPDLGNVSLDSPGANISLLVQRSALLDLLGGAIGAQNPDPMAQALFIGLGEELWDSAEAAGYLRRLTRDPLPGSGPAKRVLVTVPEYDALLPNEGAENEIRTLGVPNLAGSSVAGRVGIPDVAPPLLPDDPDFAGAATWYDLGMYGDLSDPALAAFAPPLANLASASSCDPHSATIGVAAAVRQIRTFLDDGGADVFCDGVCDGLATGGGYARSELRDGAAAPCVPQ